MKNLKAWLIGVLSLLIPGMVYAAQYKQAPPLTDVINAPVGPVKGKPVQVPLITWGGDIATIYGNGKARETTKESIFARQGLRLKLVREDDFKKQIEAYMSGKSPYLRGTMGMLNMAIEVLSGDPRTKPVVVYQMTWSTGGDALVVKEGLKSPADLCGKTIAVQAYGPHVDYLTRLISDACQSAKDVNIKWTQDLTGTDNTPGAAFRDDSAIDAAMVIIPDALALTSGGTVGTGAEDSVKGARILLSTKTASRIIADVYAVRTDYLQSHRSEVEKFVHGLMRAEEALRELVKQKSSRVADYQQMISAAADLLLDSPQAIGDAEGLYADCEYVGYRGNVTFFGDPKYPRNLDKLTREIQDAFVAVGLLSARVSLNHAKWDYERLKTGLTDVVGVEAPKFDVKEVAKVVARKQQQGTLAEGELFSFEVYFKPNQNTFSADLYGDAFAKVVELASTYGGAVIAVEGHSDPLGYLRKKKEGVSELVLKRIKQAAMNLSLTRANRVRDSVVEFAKSQRITLDPTQFATAGHGVMQPRNGMCGHDPCPPRTQQEWRNNMRVEFRIIQIEAETSAFKPL
jgi:ABC-type nitrate/sulfonate/bicarbonate transport system substrate-binding protein/outer membrane protein OmpA-like peptidoglycan-associated protein